MANGRCRMHGGTVRRGIASGTFKTGKYSKYLPGGYREAYEAAIADPDLLSMADALGVLAVRYHALLQQLEGAGVSRGIVREWRVFRSAQDRRDKHGMLAAAERLETLIEQFSADTAVWDEIRSITRDMAALSKHEQQRRMELQTLIPVSAANSFAYDLLLLVRQEVTDPEAWHRVQLGVEDLLGRYPAVANSIE